jgi:hypothetical protein
LELIFELNFLAYRQGIEKPKPFIDSFIVFYKNPKFEDIGLKDGENTKLRRTDG